MKDEQNQIADFPCSARDWFLRLPADGSAVSTSGLHGGGGGLLFLAQRGLAEFIGQETWALTREGRKLRESFGARFHAEKRAIGESTCVKRP